MCELFGICSPQKKQLNQLLREFFSHGTDHPHGWGMAFFYGGAVSLEKEAQNSCKSAYLRQRLRAKIEADQMIAHIRRATKGTMDYENTHPFVIRDDSGRAWTLAHNGTIFESKMLNPFIHEQQGQTDSERILCCIVRKVNEAQESLGRALSLEERFCLVDGIICAITPENKVNLLLFDGELFYVHTNYRDSLYSRHEGEALLVSTRPLGIKRWEPVPFCRLLAYRRGRLVFEGTRHENEFFDSEEKMRLLFLDFAGL